MDDLISDIRFAVRHGRWHLALAGTLALPDICAALQSENGETKQSKYKNWVQAHLGDKYPRFDPDEMYKMRCSLLHQGTSATLTYSRVIFFGPESQYQMHNCVMELAAGTVLLLDLRTFSADVIAAVHAWREQVKENPNYVRNSESLMRWRTNVPPFVGGTGHLLT